MKMIRLFLFMLGIGSVSVLHATNYYIHAAHGDDSNNGDSPSKAWRTVKPLSRIRFQPGDSILFATGQRCTGMLLLEGLTGTKTAPIVIASYPVKGEPQRPVLDAGSEQHALWIRNASFVEIRDIEMTASEPYKGPLSGKGNDMRCGILVDITKEETFRGILVENVRVHDVYFHPRGFTRPAGEIKTANGTQSYGWGVRFMNQSKSGVMSQLVVSGLEVYNVCHTGLKFTGPRDGIREVEVKGCKVYQTGGPGMQLSGVTQAHIHRNQISHSGSVADSRNWGRGSGLWTWGCTGILIEHNRFENANGPGDSAGVHIDYNCNDVVVQYNFSANNAGGFCEILGNNYNCAYRYNISVNDGHRIKGKNGAFQEGKTFWLSGYQGEQKPKAGPYNSYFYNNSIYVARNITPRIAVSSSSNGVLIANNLFYLETPAQKVAGDQKLGELDSTTIPNVVFTNNLYLAAQTWPADLFIQDASPLFGDPRFRKKGGLSPKDYVPLNSKMVADKGILIEPIPHDQIGLRIGLTLEKDILGNPIKNRPDLGAIELK